METRRKKSHSDGGGELISPKNKILVMVMFIQLSGSLL